MEWRSWFPTEPLLLPRNRTVRFIIDQAGYQVKHNCTLRFCYRAWAVSTVIGAFALVLRPRCGIGCLNVEWVGSRPTGLLNAPPQTSRSGTQVSPPRGRDHRALHPVAHLVQFPSSGLDGDDRRASDLHPPVDHLAVGSAPCAGVQEAPGQVSAPDGRFWARRSNARADSKPVVATFAQTASSSRITGRPDGDAQRCTASGLWWPRPWLLLALSSRIGSESDVPAWVARRAAHVTR